MGIRTIKMPDIGEGIAEAELVEWLVAPGDLIAEDQPLAAVMTDKATVEIPATFGGKVVELGGEVGKVIAIGAPLIRIEVEGEGDGAEPAPAPKAEPAKAETPAPAPAAAAPVTPAAPAPQPKPAAAPPAATARAPRPEGEAPLASPAVRARARDAGIDLRTVPGTGPAGRITHADLDAVFAAGPGTAPATTGRQRNLTVKDIKVVGLRRMIAEKMSTSRSRIPHITYVEDVDVTKLEDLRETMNAARKDGQPKLTMLPFLIRAMVIAIRDEPVVNARYDDDNGVVHQYGAVHAGIAVQTPTGLVVANLRHAEARGIWDCGTELVRLAEAGRKGQLTREELTGSTITITSLGPMGGISHTPIINHPEVAIVGVNKMQIRPVWDGSGFVPRKVMNLSSSFDHRIVDGWNAATFVQRIKTLMEEPALLFTEGEA